MYSHAFINRFTRASKFITYMKLYKGMRVLQHCVPSEIQYSSHRHVLSVQVFAHGVYLDTFLPIPLPFMLYVLF